MDDRAGGAACPVLTRVPMLVLCTGMASPAEQTTKLLLAGFVDIVQAISGDGLYAEVTASKPNYEVGSTGGMLSFAAPAQVRQLRHHSRPFRTHFSAPCHSTHAVRYALDTWCPCSSDVDGCLQSDVVPNSIFRRSTWAHRPTPPGRRRRWHPCGKSRATTSVTTW